MSNIEYYDTINFSGKILITQVVLKVVQLTKY